MKAMKNNLIVPAALVAVGLLALGLCLRSGIESIVNRDRVVAVKGLAEREVKADKVTWSITTKETGNDLKGLYATVNQKTDIIEKFLKDNGLTAEEISRNAPKVQDYIAEGSYSQDAKFRYALTSNITVVSTHVDTVRALIARQGELLDQGIAITGENNWENPVVYDFTGFQDIKEEMMAEAIANAEKTAQQFAKNSKSKLNKIITADQGQFDITDRDSNTPYIKNVRGVTTITYSLKN